MQRYSIDILSFRVSIPPAILRALSQDPQQQQIQMRQFGESVMAKFNKLCEPINQAKNDVDRIRLRLEMGDDDIVHLIMGERFLQIQYEMQQQQQMMMQQQRGGF